MIRDEVSQETRRTDILAQGQFHGKDQSRCQASRKAQLNDLDASLMVHFDAKHAQSTGVLNSSFEPSALLIVDEGVKLDDNKQRLKAELPAPSAMLAFKCSNATLAFNVTLAFRYKNESYKLGISAHKYEVHIQLPSDPKCDTRI